ncbi:hypothetical protein LCGC14_0465850 [marine sediment metagenome]|uniref:Methyltransferase type 11 domain-containing protein n=1 Tax=marine sediment metagenome TaxID=412755 RepID=A0A0F9V0I9_9ZZZZ
MINNQTQIRINKMQEFIGETKDKIVLEIGIGEYEFDIKTKKKYTLDIVGKYKPDLLCDLNKEVIPLDDETVDLVIVGEVLEHLINPYNVVREFYRILKPNGIVVASSPNICSLVNRFRMIFGNLPTYCAEPIDEENPERHIVDFNKKYFKDIFNKADFEIERITSNGIISKGIVISEFCPTSWGETLIIKVRK